MSATEAQIEDRLPVWEALCEFFLDTSLHSEDYERIALWAVCASAVFTVFVAYEKNKQGWFWCMVFVAILFNPLAPVEFKHRAWQFIDVLAAITFFMASKLP